MMKVSACPTLNILDEAGSCLTSSTECTILGASPFEDMHLSSPNVIRSPLRVQVDIDLPQIAVIGAQSAGKSSLIESISGITLPRASGTCTRYEHRIYSRHYLIYCLAAPRNVVWLIATLLGSALCTFAGLSIKTDNPAGKRE